MKPVVIHLQTIDSMDKVEKIKQLFRSLSGSDKREIIEFINKEVQSEDSKGSKGIFTGPVPSSESDVCEKCGKPLQQP